MVPMPATERAIGRATIIFCAMLASVHHTGCSLRHYREDADAEAYSVVAEKSNDPRWDQPGYTIEMDPRSRYFEPYDQDRQPMPPDDPAAHVYMHVVNGYKGWPHWDDNGHRQQLENPYWRDAMCEYVELSDDGKVKLNIDSALRLAYMHSPDYQGQLETLYLSALDVTTERFQLETQFFGGNETRYEILGGGGAAPGNPPTLGAASLLTNTSDFQVRRNFATAGELLVGFANSFVWQFDGSDSNGVVSLLNFNFIQPLLRNGGRDRALERLTRVERGLLGNVRQLAQYRQGFYTGLAIGSFGVRGVGRLGGFAGATGLTGFSGTGQGGLGGVGQITGFGGGFFGGGGAGGGAGGGTGLAGGGAGQVGGFVGLLQSLQEIRNTQYSLDLQLRTLALLEANLEAGTIDLTQVDQFRQNIETLRAQLLQARTGLEASQDDFKTGTLGLPPDLEVELDDSMIRQFQMIDPEITALQDRIADLQTAMGALPLDPDAQSIQQMIDRAKAPLEDYRQQFDITSGDIDRMQNASATRKQTMSQEEQSSFDRDMQLLNEDFSKRPPRFADLEAQLQQMEQNLGPNTRQQTLDQLVGWVRALGDEVQSISLIQARARLEAIVLEPVKLDSRTALEIARANRLDYMNTRTALVDSWRLIAFNADQLQSVLDVEVSGDVRNRGDNPLNFDGTRGRLEARLEFDAPFTRLIERNNYRQALVDYQESRRGMIQYDDGIHQSLRNQLRNLEQLRTNLEIQRRAVVISIRRVDYTRSELNRPLPAPAPGDPPATFGPTAVQNLLSALSDLSNAQNNFMSVWLNYYAGRMNLVRDLGVMELDDQGRWIDRPLDEILSDACGYTQHLPPDVPQDWWELGGPPSEEGQSNAPPHGELLPDNGQRPERLPPPNDLPPDPSAALKRLPPVVST